MKNKISLALSSGGARGLAHIGVVETLIEKGYQIEEISGSSIGSVIASMYASGNLNKFKSWVLSLDKLRVFSLMDFTIGGYGVMKGDKVFNKLKTIIKDEKIEDLRTPINIIASDVFKVKEKVFRKGSMYEAMRASCSIPGLVRPYVYKKTELIDGGVLNPLPIKHLKKQNQILAVNLNNTPKLKKNKQKTLKHQHLENKYFNIFKDYFSKKTPYRKRLNVFDLTYKSIHMMQNKLAKETMSKHSVDFVVNIPFDSCYPLEFYKAKQMIKLGRDLCEEVLKKKQKTSIA